MRSTEERKDSVDLLLLWHRLFNPDVYFHLGILRIRCTLIIDFKIGLVGPVSSGCGFGYCPDAAPSLRNHLPNESFLRSKHTVSPGWNSLGHHPRGNVVCRAYPRA